MKCPHCKQEILNMYSTHVFTCPEVHKITREDFLRYSCRGACSLCGAQGAVTHGSREGQDGLFCWGCIEKGGILA